MKKTVTFLFLLMPLFLFSQNEEKEKHDGKNKLPGKMNYEDTGIYKLKLTKPGLTNTINTEKYQNKMLIVTEKLSDHVQLNNKFFLTNSSSYVRYPGLGEVYSIRSLMSYRPNERILLSFGPGAVRSSTPIDINAVLQLSFYSSVKYQLTDWLYLKLYGQYVTLPVNKEQKSPNVFSYMNPMYPQSMTGAEMFVKYKNIKVDAGPRMMYDTGFKKAPVTRSFNTKVTVGI